MWLWLCVILCVTLATVLAYRVYLNRNPHKGKGGGLLLLYTLTA